MASMTTEETFKFLDLYRKENCLWNPKNKYHKNKNKLHDSWERISVAMGLPIHELKRKKENLMATFRLNLKKMKAGADAEDGFQPIWIFFDAMAEFLSEVYESTSLLNTEEKAPPVLSESSYEHTGDIFAEVNVNDLSASTPLVNSNIKVKRRRAMDSPELQEASIQLNSALKAINSALSKKREKEEEDECDLFCKMLAKKIKAYPKRERDEIMYELHGVLINRHRRRRYEETVQGSEYDTKDPEAEYLDS